jgi:hypothetical protein
MNHIHSNTTIFGRVCKNYFTSIRSSSASLSMWWYIASKPFRRINVQAGLNKLIHITHSNFEKLLLNQVSVVIWTSKSIGRRATLNFIIIGTAKWSKLVYYLNYLINMKENVSEPNDWAKHTNLFLIHTMEQSKQI